MAGESGTAGRLFGADGQLLGENDNGGEGANFRLARTLPRGVYHMAIGAPAAHRTDAVGDLLTCLTWVVSPDVV